MSLALEDGQEPIEILDCDWVRPERGFISGPHQANGLDGKRTFFVVGRW
jgi:hypothetical protein